MLPIILGLCSALSWGAGDFTGGLAARKAGAQRVVFYGELIGIFVLFVVIAFLGESIPGRRARTYALLAGVLGTVGLLCLYHSMTLGLMSIAAPVSALLAAALPVVIGIFREGLPSVTTLIGFGFALFAVWMISRGNESMEDLLSHLSDLKLPLLAGVGFGLYFILMHEATDLGSTAWPMVFSRFGGMLLVALYMLVARSGWKVETPSAWPIIALNGVLDLSGNLFFILASQAGRLDVSSVLSSLFPGSTVILASIFLKERLTRGQGIGIASALTAIVLMTV